MEIKVTFSVDESELSSVDVLSASNNEDKIRLLMQSYLNGLPFLFTIDEVKSSGGTLRLNHKSGKYQFVKNHV